MGAALDRLYLYAGYAAGGFLVLIFVLMMGLSLGRQVGVGKGAGRWRSPRSPSRPPSFSTSPGTPSR